MPHPMAPQTDYLGQLYVHLAEGLKFEVKQFIGILERTTLNTPEQMEEALKFGEYLEKQGHKRFTQANIFQLTIGWYFSTYEAGLTDTANEKEYAFSFSINRRYIYSLCERADVEPLKAELLVLEQTEDAYLNKVRASVERNLKARGLE